MGDGQAHPREDKKNSHEICGSQKIKNYRGEVVDKSTTKYMKAWGKSLHTGYDMGKPVVFLVNIIAYSYERDINSSDVLYEFC